MEERIEAVGDVGTSLKIKGFEPLGPRRVFAREKSCISMYVQLHAAARHLSLQPKRLSGIEEQQSPAQNLLCKTRVAFSVVSVSKPYRSIYPWDQPPRHHSTILVPLLPILCCTSRLVSPRTMREQHAHVQEIAPRQQLAQRSACSAHGERQQQVCRVV